MSVTGAGMYSMTGCLRATRRVLSGLQENTSQAGEGIYAAIWQGRITYAYQPPGG